MSEPTIEEQAQMAIKLADSVRELIRKEIVMAVNDPTFMESIKMGLRQSLFNGVEWDYHFQGAVKRVVKDQMDRP